VAYYPFAQRPGRLVAHLAAQGNAQGDRATSDPEMLVRPVRQAIGELDGVLDIDVETLRSATSLELSMRRSATGMLGAVGAIGLMLAMIGLYGVVASSVAARRTEIGLRMALGASAGRLRLAVLGQCLRLVVAGIVLGWALSLPMTPKLATFLAGTSPFDPVAFGGTALVLIVVGLLAGYLPAHRASRVDPTVALRQD
jgi:ABC-type antimicrobial peptide transport system permease subunit